MSQYLYIPTTHTFKQYTRMRLNAKHNIFSSTNNIFWHKYTNFLLNGLEFHPKFSLRMMVSNAIYTSQQPINLNYTGLQQDFNTHSHILILNLILILCQINLDRL